MRRPRLVLLSLALALASAAAPAARADDEPTEEEKVLARKLFQEGLDRERDNDWAGAFALFEKFAAIKVTPQVKFHLALCDENLGRWLAALQGFEQAIELAKADPDKNQQVLENAPERSKALRERVPHVVVKITGYTDGVRVLLDDQPLSASVLGTRLPVDPGKHAIVVQSEGRTVHTKSVELAAKAVEEVSFEVKPPPKADTALPPEKPKAPEEPPSKVPVYVLAGGAAAGLIVAGAMIGLRESRLSEIRDSCDEDGSDCDPDLRPLEEEAEGFTIGAAVAGGVGLAAAGTAIALWFVLEPSPKKTPPSTGVSLDVGPTWIGLRGRFF